MDFKSLHQQTQLLFIGNVWDALSARLFEKLNFKAIATSSAAIAHMLGYEDGQRITFTELEYVVKKILSATSLPLSVDMESGYSKDISVIISHIERLHRLGVVGKRISMGNYLQQSIYDQMETNIAAITHHQSFQPIF